MYYTESVASPTVYYQERGQNPQFINSWWGLAWLYRHAPGIFGKSRNLLRARSGTGTKEIQGVAHFLVG